MDLDETSLATFLPLSLPPTSAVIQNNCASGPGTRLDANFHNPATNLRRSDATLTASCLVPQLLLARDDALTEIHQLVKLGRLRVRLMPDPFIGATLFSQTLDLASGEVHIAAANGNVSVKLTVRRIKMPLK